MKLSDIKGEATFDVMADLVSPVLSIATDDDAAAMFRKEPVPEGQTAREFALGKAKRCLPKLLRDHKTDLIAICAALRQVDPKEYTEGLTLMSLTKDVFELVSDEDFIGFLS